MDKKYIFLWVLGLIGVATLVTAQILTIGVRDYEFELFENQTDILRENNLLEYTVTNIDYGEYMVRCLFKEFNDSIILSPCFRYKITSGIWENLDEKELEYMEELADDLLDDANEVTPIVNSTGTSTITSR